MEGSKRSYLGLSAAQFRPAPVIGAAVSTLALVGSLDYLTGFEISFAVFYLVPVSIAAWYAGRNWGLVLALGASLSWYIAETAVGYPYSHPAIPIWNACVRLSFFLIISLLLATLRIRLLRENRLAKTDALTGLLNLRAFIERLEHDLALAARTGNPLTLAYVDLDDFKQVNDLHGHRAGDTLLCAVADRLRHSTRSSDTVARLGGDEFAIILPATDIDGARAIIAKVRRKLGAAYDTTEAATCSVGAVVIRNCAANAGTVLAAADRLMYEAKRSGKNALVIDYYLDEALEPKTTPPASDRQRSVAG